MEPRTVAILLCIVSTLLASFSVYMNIRASQKLKLAREFYDLAKQLYDQMQPQKEEHKEA